MKNWFNENNTICCFFFYSNIYFSVIYYPYKILGVTLSKTEKNQRPLKKGHLLLQEHDTKVSFRSLKIKELQ